MTIREFPSGRFGYAMGFKSRDAAQDAFDSMCCEGEMSPCEGRIESYNASASAWHRVTRWAVTIN
jgi:hypothetical protein